MPFRSAMRWFPTKPGAYYSPLTADRPNWVAIPSQGYSPASEKIPGAAALRAYGNSGISSCTGAADLPRQCQWRLSATPTQGGALAGVFVPFRQLLSS